MYVLRGILGEKNCNICRGVYCMGSNILDLTVDVIFKKFFLLITRIFSRDFWLMFLTKISVVLEL